MLSKEEAIHNYWMAEYHHNKRKREQRAAKKAERAELDKPEYTLGIVNDEGQLEIVQAKPVSPTLKLLPEVLGFMLFFMVTYAFFETYIGALL